jgi:GTP-binding protein
MINTSANHLFAQPCTFVMGCAALEALPPATLPEIAFAGRSNVGKSSLVNALTGRSTLAKASNTPGRTRQLNFFLLAERLMLVDLPGYGYAQAPRKEVRQWTHLVKDYLTGRPNLMRVLLLIDARHGLKDVDEGIMDLLDTAAVTYQIVLTKADKVKPAALATLVETMAAKLKARPAAHPQIIATSSVNKDGIERLREELAAFVEGKSK